MRALRSIAGWLLLGIPGTLALAVTRAELAKNRALSRALGCTESREDYEP